MTSLFHNLPALEASAQEMGPMLAALLEHGQEAERAAGDLLARIEARRADVDALTEEVEEALSTLSREADQRRAQVESSVKEAEAATDELQAGLHDIEQDLARATQAAEQALSTLGAEARRAADEADAAEGRVADAVTSLGDSANAGARALRLAVEGAVEHANGLRSMVDESQQLLTAAAKALEERMSETLERGRARVAQTAALLETCVKAHEASLADLGGVVDAEAREQPREVAEWIDGGVQPALHAGYDAACEAMEALAQVMEQARESFVDDIHTLFGVLGTIRDKVLPLQAGVQAVREAAQQVGLMF